MKSTLIALCGLLLFTANAFADNVIAPPPGCVAARPPYRIGGGKDQAVNQTYQIQCQDNRIFIAQFENAQQPVQYFQCDNAADDAKFTAQYKMNTRLYCRLTPPPVEAASTNVTGPHANIGALAAKAETQFQCQNNNDPYGTQSVSDRNLFTMKCGGNGIVGEMQADQSWTFKSCGPAATSRPPSMPDVPPEQLGAMFAQQKQVMTQDTCNVWKPLTVAPAVQKQIKQEKASDAAFNAAIEQQTGCKVGSNINLTLNGVKSTTLQLLCPGNIVKVAHRAKDNAPFEIHVCQSANDKVTFQDGSSGDYCDHAGQSQDNSEVDLKAHVIVDTSHMKSYLPTDFDNKAMNEADAALQKGDQTKALQLFQTAANQNYAAAQCMLGSMYGNGMGTPKDFVKAYMWYTIGLSNPVPSKNPLYSADMCKTLRDALVQGMHMTDQQIAEGGNLAKNWKPQK